jgi:hypothetical protein
MTRADIAVIALALVFVAALTAHYWQPARAASEVEVRSGSTQIGRYPLAQDRGLDVQGREGISHLEIRAGRVRFTASPCRNKVCVNSGWLSHAGDTTACVPNGVSITLIGGDEAYDAISF